MFVLQRMHPHRHIFCRILWKNRATELGNNVSLVIMFVDILDSDATLAFACLHDGLMDTIAIHTFATKLRQERRMNIYDTLWISMQQRVGHLRQEASQHNEIHPIVGQKLQNFFASRPLLLTYINTRNMQILRPFENIHILTVRHDQHHSAFSTFLLEITDDVFGIRTIA